MCDEKLARLRERLRSLGSVAVAFSGGADSSLLLKVASEELGDRAIAVMNISPLTPPGDEEEAVRVAGSMGVRLLFTRADPLGDPAFRQGPPDRCYLCKRRVFEAIAAAARGRGAEHIVDGTNADDLAEDRPGRRALREAGVISPLLEAGLTKDEVRALGRKLSVPSSDRPAGPCLVTRLPFNEEVTVEKLEAVGRAEQVMHRLGFPTVRVRHHGRVARIEVPDAMIDSVLMHREIITAELKKIGFIYVAVDLQGFRSGSMADTIDAGSNQGTHIKTL